MTNIRRRDFLATDAIAGAALAAGDAQANAAWAAGNQSLAAIEAVRVSVAQCGGIRRNGR